MGFYPACWGLNQPFPSHVRRVPSARRVSRITTASHCITLQHHDTSDVCQEWDVFRASPLHYTALHCNITTHQTCAKRLDIHTATSHLVMRETRLARCGVAVCCATLQRCDVVVCCATLHLCDVVVRTAILHLRDVAVCTATLHLRDVAVCTATL